MNNKIEAVIDAYKAYKSALYALDIGEVWEFEGEWGVWDRLDIVKHMTCLFAEERIGSGAWDKYMQLCDDENAMEHKLIDDHIDIIREARIAGLEAAERKAKAEFERHDYFVPKDVFEEDQAFYGEIYDSPDKCPCLSRAAIDKALVKLKIEEPYESWSYHAVLKYDFRPATDEEIKQRGIKDA